MNEAVEQQAATADILNIISNSPSDTQPVFEAIVQSLLKLFPNALISLALRYGDRINAAAVADRDSERAEAWRRTISRTPLSREYMHGAAMLDRRIVDVSDAKSAPAEFSAGARNFLTSGNRAITITPMMRRNEAIGLLSVVRRTPGPLSEKQLSVLRAFAAQAVIAIENTRLLNELREALQQQTATSEVLKVISSSPSELKPVFDAILEHATRICEAKFGTLGLYDGEAFHSKALCNVPPEYAEARQRQPVWRPPPGSASAKVVRTKRPVLINDLSTSPGYLEGDSIIRATVDKGDARTMLLVPMLKDDQLVGMIAIYRKEVQRFTDKQIALVQNFAAQAVIAIENARLLSELRQRTAALSEALDQQTATSEVLKVISSSPSDLRPVFQSMLENSVRICEAKFGQMFLCEGDKVRPVAYFNVPAALVQWDEERGAFQPSAKGGLMRAILSKNVLRIDDFMSEQPSNPVVKLGGARSYIAVPMLKESELVGVIVIYRQEVRPFTEKQVDLVQNFATQAVIAIENARLLNDLNKLNQQLEHRVADQVGEIERMGKLRRFLPPQVADLIVATGMEKQLESHRREITALFCDLRGFTGFSESSDPEDVMALLHEYHAAIGGIINKYGGTLERYAGDGVMVVFNDPIPVDNPALQAVRMAIDMRAAIGELIEKWRKLGHDIGFGIGIAHGFATLGTIGFEGRFDYAAIGTVSNVASRLCDEAKPGQILISPRVLMALEDAISVEPVGEFKLKGISRPLATYNVLSAASAKI